MVGSSGEDSKLSEVLDRTTQLIRVDFKVNAQVLAANLGSLLIVTTPSTPPFREGLLDRYLVAAYAAGLEPVVCLNKLDLGVPKVEQVLRVREKWRAWCRWRRKWSGMEELAVSLSGVVRRHTVGAVGHSGVMQTSLVRALCLARLARLAR